MPRLIVSRSARRDLINLGDYIALDNRSRARSFVTEIEQVIVEQIAVRPASFRLREELAPGMRSATYGRYLILFTTDKDAIVIVCVVHGSRDLASLF